MDNKQTGDREATTSMILGIISAASCLLGWVAVIAIVCGIIGLVYASKAKELGYEGGKRTAGFVLSVIGLSISALSLVSCLACGGLLTCSGVDALGLYESALNI